MSLGNSCSGNNQEMYHVYLQARFASGRVRLPFLDTDLYEASVVLPPRSFPF